jgi:hypothetical protein
MSTNLLDRSAARHRVIPEIHPQPAKADLRKPETRAYWAEIGGCLDSARRAAGWNLDELSAELKRDPRQVRRWIAGEEQTQIAVVFAVEALRAPFVVALARIAGTGVEIETVVRVRRQIA